MRRAVFATVVILMLSLSLAAQTLPNYTAAQVAQHSTSTDCWIILNSTEVYNVTAYLSLHPAGPSPITPYCGKDATTAFNNVGHSSHAVFLEATYLIGNLVAASTISVSVSPTTATVTAGQTQSFTATVSGSTQGVTWKSTSIGTIDANGLFTAVSAGTGTVTATSVEDPTKSATATVTVTAAGGGGGGGTVSVTISPATASVRLGAKQQFSAKVSGSTSGVTWTVTGSVGTVDSNGMFTATAAGMGVVKATSVSDPTMSASANVTVTQSGAACAMTSAHGSFSLNCTPASAIPAGSYYCAAKTSGSSTVVQCRAGRTGTGGGGTDE